MRRITARHLLNELWQRNPASLHIVNDDKVPGPKWTTSVSFGYGAVLINGHTIPVLEVLVDLALAVIAYTGVSNHGPSINVDPTLAYRRPWISRRLALNHNNVRNNLIVRAEEAGALRPTNALTLPVRIFRIKVTRASWADHWAAVNNFKVTPSQPRITRTPSI